MSYSLSDRMEIFGEYRYVYSDPQYDLKSAIDPATANNTTPTNVRGTFEMDIESHQLYSGISFRF